MRPLIPRAEAALTRADPVRKLPGIDPLDSIHPSLFPATNPRGLQNPYQIVPPPCPGLRRAALGKSAKNSVDLHGTTMQRESFAVEGYRRPVGKRNIHPHLVIRPEIPGQGANPSAPRSPHPSNSERTLSPFERRASRRTTVRASSIPAPEGSDASARWTGHTPRRPGPIESLSPVDGIPDARRAP